MGTTYAPVVAGILFQLITTKYFHVTLYFKCCQHGQTNQLIRTMEPCHEKPNILHMREQRRRSASR